ncbi:fungal-specific transcription factor domain-containing protein [Nemania sp. FL0031]|nr:fungal-specific transcription factor domain-containing protein [Nemania sp. FL0031]
MTHRESESEDDTYEDEADEDRSRRPEKMGGTRADDGPACQSCRRKKAKCSRTQPCSHCERQNLQCVYDERKINKPGMRTGAIEQLNQRLTTLENMFLGQGILWQQLWSRPGTQETAPPTPDTPDTLEARTAQLRQSLVATQRDGGHLGSLDPEQIRAAKRRRTNQSRQSSGTDSLLNLEGEDFQLPKDLEDSLVEIYFARIHPWIPVLHVTRFRQSLRIPPERARLKIVLRAIASLCTRFSNDPRLGDEITRSKLVKACRGAVILGSVESLSVENLQALTICAFDTIGSGRGPSAWSIVGSMARTIEYLQLSVEETDNQRPPRQSQVLIERVTFLPPSQTWVEIEGRRRLFWNVFLMDRFCSVATGWNVSLKSREVKRTLPCEGKIWERGETPLDKTPYLGVSDQYSELDGATVGASPGHENTDMLGGFAYCIEATESLSLVTSFFLHQSVDVTSAHEIQHWLLRFKKLDLRLVQWKLFLPEKWQQACALNEDGIMDPNLTLAHITHNTAVVILHQSIAYPLPDWRTIPIRLPTGSSAETCLAAAREVAIIAHNFLQGGDFLTNPQFAFCLFICGRMLLAHSGYYRIDIDAAFDSLIQSLQEISQRWEGPFASSKSACASNLASKFAQRLLEARHLGPNSLDIRQPAFSKNTAGAFPVSPHQDGAAEIGPLQQDEGQSGHSFTHHENQGPIPYYGGHMEQQASPDSISLAFPPLPSAFQVPGDLTGSMQSSGFADFQNLSSEPSRDFGQRAREADAFSSSLELSFLPNERISVYSILPSTDAPQGRS